MRFARGVFRGAGIYGLLVLLPQYLLEDRIGQDTPPAITHPEYFHGFVGVALAWQIAFLVIAQNPVRYRLMMLPASLEKFSFVAAILILYLQGRAGGPVLAFALIDLLLGILFLVAYRSSGSLPDEYPGTENVR